MHVCVKARRKEDFFVLKHSVMMACREPAGKPPYILDLGTRHR
jgi:hypothetical protein